ncbi:MAG: caspase family protein [Acidobacteria bacterium]|nr:caspase family protein [Acidobacteriota bacterium]
MREKCSVIILILILAVFPASPFRSYIWGAGGQDAPLRAPFSLELPDIGGGPFTDQEKNIPTSNLHKLRLRVRKPYADAINYGKIYTKVNGEASGVIQTPGRDRDDHIVVTLDLDRYPRFKLRSGRNVIEIQAIDNGAHSYYASYVLHASLETNNDPGQLTGATIETAPVNTGDDRQPPTVYLTNPSGGGRVSRVSKSLAVQGVATDDSGILASVTVNGQPAKLTPVTGSRLLLQLETKAAVQEFAFARAIALGNAVSALIIEAKDQAGNLTRITLPLNPVPLPPRDGGFTGRKFAVIIGVSSYRDEGISDLQYADDDARDLRDFLQRPEGGGFKATDILYLENEQATIENVKAALDRILTQAGTDDLILFFIAGHGGPDPYAPQNLYYVLHDTKVRDLSGTALPMTTLQEKFNQARARRALVFVDTCHSAGLTGKQPAGTRSLENNLINLYSAKLFKEEGRAALTSSDVNELSHESLRWGGGHGVFTYALLEGLRGQADANSDRFVTAGELFAYVRDRVRLETGFKQNPRSLYDFNGDFTIAAVAGK